MCVCACAWLRVKRLPRFKVQKDFCLRYFFLTTSVCINHCSVSLFSESKQHNNSRKRGDNSLSVQVYRPIFTSDILILIKIATSLRAGFEKETRKKTYQDFAGWTEVDWAKTEADQERRKHIDLLDNVYAPQSCPQEKGNCHSPASLLPWTADEETQNREGEDKQGKLWGKNTVNVRIREKTYL